MEAHPHSTPGPLHQLRLAARSPGALALGVVIGGFVPVASYVTVHDGGMLTYGGGRLHVTDWTDPRWSLVLGALAFSAKSVYQWAHAAFDDRVKALGFTVICEGVLLMSTTPWLGYAAIAMLVLVNVLSSGAVLALRDRRDTTLTAEPVSETPIASIAPQVRSLTADSADSEGDDAELYRRAVEHVRSGGRCSGRALRLALGCGTTKASELAKRLTSEASLADCAE